MQVDNTLSGTREAVASAVRVEMARKRMSQAKLADATGLNAQYVSRRMTGEVAFNTDDLALIAAALDVSMAELLPTAGAPARAA